MRRDPKLLAMPPAPPPPCLPGEAWLPCGTAKATDRDAVGLRARVTDRDAVGLRGLGPPGLRPGEPIALRLRLRPRELALREAKLPPWRLA